MALADSLRKLPKSPGVYQFFDAEEKMLYVGKALSLKSRVTSYFRSAADKSVKTMKLVEKIDSIRWIETTSETEALILESNIIKEHQPPFNVLLRDDKHFLYIVLTSGSVPRLITARKLSKEGGTFFGPKSDSQAVRRMIDFLEKLFFETVTTPHPETNEELVKTRRKKMKLPDPFFAPGMSPGPMLDSPACIAAIDEWKRAATLFLKGKTKGAEKLLESAMIRASEEKNFEQAARLRDRLLAVQHFSEKQAVSDTAIVDRDVIAVEVIQTKAYVALLEIRSGKLVDQKNMQLDAKDASIEEIVENLLLQWYLQRATAIPKEIMLPAELAEGTEQYIKKVLAESAGHSIHLLHPQRGSKARLMRLAGKNAASYAVQARARFENAESRTVKAAAETATLLGISKVLNRIECYDISHLAGTHTTGSMVVAVSGEPASKEYRHFSVKGLTPGISNDYAAMAEVLKRRLSYICVQIPKEISIRKATKKQSLAAKEMHEAGGGYVKRWEESPLVLVALDDTKNIIGYIRQINAGKHQVVAGLQVDEKWRGRGIGSALLKVLEQKTTARKLYLNCSMELRQWYIAHGWHEIQRPEPCYFNVKEYGAEDHVFFMREVGKKDDSSFAAVPELIVLDGGKGQLSAVQKKCHIPKRTRLAALAKRFEDVFLLEEDGRVKKIPLKKDSPPWLLLTRIRDEAHRFANELRKKKIDKRDRGK